MNNYPRKIAEDDENVKEKLADTLRNELIEEVKFFCVCLFDRLPSAELIATYILAHEKLPGNLLKGRDVINKIVNLKLDAIAIEFAQRRNLKPLNLKLILICYLAENLPGYEDNFVLKTDKKLLSFLSLSKILFETPYLFLKGNLIVKKHGLV